MSLHPSQYLNAVRFVSAPTKNVASRLHCTEEDLSFLKLSTRSAFYLRVLIDDILLASDAVKSNLCALLVSLSPEDGPSNTTDIFLPIFASYIYQHIDRAVGKSWFDYSFVWEGFHAHEGEVMVNRRVGYILRKLLAATEVK